MGRQWEAEHLHPLAHHGQRRFGDSPPLERRALSSRVAGRAALHIVDQVQVEEGADEIEHVDGFSGSVKLQESPIVKILVDAGAGDGAVRVRAGNRHCAHGAVTTGVSG